MKKTILISSFVLMFVLFIGLGLTAYGQENTLTLPADITEIKDYAFAGCSGFTGSLSIPNSVTRIGAHAFDGCTGLTGTVILPETVETIGEGAFDNTGLYVLTWNEYLELYEYELNNDGITITSFYTNGHTFHDFTIPQSINGMAVTEIGEYALSNENSLTGNLYIPNTVRKIGCGAFYECGFSSISPLPNTLQYMGEVAFSGCVGLSGEVNIPETVTYWGHDVFGRTDIQEKWNHWAISWRIVDNKAVITSFHGRVKGTVRLPDTLDGYDVVQIGDGNQRVLQDFNPQNWASIEGTLIMPSTLKVVCEDAFAYADGEFMDGTYGLLSGTVVLPDGLMTLKETAFYQCRINHINFPEGIEIISKAAFRRCYYLEGDLVFPEGLMIIGTEAFNECFSLNGTLTLPESLIEIGSYAFYRTSLQGQIILPPNLERIGRNAFALTQFTALSDLPEKLETIGDYAFAYTSVIPDGQAVIIPSSVTYVGKDAFTGLFSEAIIVYADGRTPEIDWLFEKETFYNYNSQSIETGYFIMGCNGVETDNVKLPTTYQGEPVVGVGFYALYDCTNLKGTLIIPEGYYMLNSGAFSGCINLTGLPVIPSTMQRLFADSFGGCTGLTGTLILPEDIRFEGNPFTGSNLTVYRGEELVYEPY